MNYLYHMVPKNMAGTLLYPLNELKEQFPEIYKGAIKKYEGREFIQQQIIPYFNCLWNDVIHMSAVHPEKIREELEKDGSELKWKQFFEIDPNILESDKTLVYLYSKPKVLTKFQKEDFVPFIPDEIENFSELPEATKEYYKEKINEQEKPLLWHRVPHILYKGFINIESVNIISV